MATSRCWISGLSVLIVSALAVTAQARSPSELWPLLDGHDDAPWDLDAIVAHVGKSPDALLSWVQKTTRWERYDGSQRGPEGTARAQGGSTLDRALLLEALLEKAGHEPVVMQAPLPAKQVPALTAERAQRALAIKEIPARAAEVSAYHAQHKADEALAEAALTDSHELARALAARVSQDMKPAPLTPITTHYWVELGGKAYDLERAERPAGKVMTAAQREAKRHTLTVALVLQRTRDGRPEEVVLASIPAPLDEVAWQPIEIDVGPDRRAADLAKVPADAVLRASLQVGRARHGAAPFDRTGRTFSVSAAGAAGEPAELGGALGGALGGFGGGFGGKPKGGALAFTALVLRVEVSGPDERKSLEPRHERVLLDRDDLPAVSVSLLAEGAGYARGQREVAAVRALLALRPAIEAIEKQQDAAAALPMPSAPSALLMRYADVRGRVQAALAKREGALAYRERTGLVALVERVVAGNKLRSHIDILANPVVFVREGKRDASLAIVQGVADTRLEAALIDASVSAWHKLEPLDVTNAELAKSGRMRRVPGADGAYWSVDPTTGATVGRLADGSGGAMIEYAYQVASKVCDWAHVLSMYAAGNYTNRPLDTTNKVAEWVCAAASGEAVQQYMSGKIGEVSETLWKIAIPSILGIPIIVDPE